MFLSDSVFAQTCGEQVDALPSRFLVKLGSRQDAGHHNRVAAEFRGHRELGSEFLDTNFLRQRDSCDVLLRQGLAVASAAW